MQLSNLSKRLPIESTYTPTHVEKAKGVDRWGDPVTYSKVYGVRHQHRLTLQTSTKILIILVMVIGNLALSLLWMRPLGFLIGPVIMFSWWLSWKATWGATAIPSPRGIADEVRSVHNALTRLDVLRELVPEGSENIAKIDEYGRLAFEALRQVELLPSDVGGSHSNSYRARSQVQQELQTLSDAGNELVDLIGTVRTENTVHGIRHLGIDEYANSISIATAAYRSLTTGEDKDDEEAKVENHPKKTNRDYNHDYRSQLGEALIGDLEEKRKKSV